jgi:hypothetical protein
VTGCDATHRAPTWINHPADRHGSSCEQPGAVSCDDQVDAVADDQAGGGQAGPGDDPVDGRPGAGAPPGRGRSTCGRKFRTFLYGRAWTHAEGPVALFNHAVAWLRRHRVLLPGVSVLAR